MNRECNKPKRSRCARQFCGLHKCDPSARCVRQFCGLYRAHIKLVLSAARFAADVHPSEHVAELVPAQFGERERSAQPERAPPDTAAIHRAAHRSLKAVSGPGGWKVFDRGMVDACHARACCRTARAPAAPRVRRPRRARRAARPRNAAGGGQGSLVSTGTSMRSCGSDSSSGRRLPHRRPARVSVVVGCAREGNICADPLSLILYWIHWILYGISI